MQKETNAIQAGVDYQFQYNRIWLICFSILIFGFLIIVWRNIYKEMSQNNKWVNGFILLIPIQILQENQYLKSYLKRKLNVNALNYA